VAADAGYLHGKQIDQLMGQGIQVLIPPDADKRRPTRPGWDGGRYALVRRSSRLRLPGSSTHNAGGRFRGNADRRAVAAAAGPFHNDLHALEARTISLSHVVGSPRGRRIPQLRFVTMGQASAL
jgi:hypothetical protein